MVRAAAAAALVGAVALPMIRRRLRARGVRPEAILAGTALAPVAAAVLWPRVRSRAAIVCALQMYAYVYAYKLPNDDEAALAARVHFDYPIRADRLLGFGELPSVRLQRALHPDGDFHAYEKVLVWAHWVWFATPHASLAYLYFHDRPRFARAARADLRRVRHRRDRLLARAHRPAVVRRPAGPPERRARRRCAG